MEAMQAAKATEPAALTFLVAMAFVVGVGCGAIAGAWASRNAIADECAVHGRASAGEVTIDCSNVRARSTAGFR